MSKRADQAERLDRPAGDSALSELRFDSLPLPDTVAQGVREAGFEYCTPIQAAALPIALDGRDVAGQAQTGTGKTAAYLLVVFARLLEQPGDRRDQPRALIVAPTRELAIQIHRDAEQLGAATGLRLGLAYGGVDYDKQRREIEDGVDILIGTPGRLIDYFKKKVFNLKSLRAVVLDEADRMFDLGFIKDIRFLLRRCPPPDQRQSMLFSATLAYKVTELAYEHMNNPELIKVEASQVTARNIDERVYFPANPEKLPLLVSLLRSGKDYHAMVFTNTRHAASEVERILKANGFKVAMLSGNVPQQKRQKLLDRFHKGDVHILVATDVAARGLHIPDVSHVFNYDLPQDAEDYVHRIGRTARLGATGSAISFACETYAFHLPEIEDYIGHRLPQASVEPDDLPDIERPPAPPRKPRSGKKGAGKRGAGNRGGGARRGGRRRGGSGGGQS